MLLFTPCLAQASIIILIIALGKNSCAAKHNYFDNDTNTNPYYHERCRFVYRKEYFIKRTYRYSDFENKKINIYRYDVTNLPDSIPIQLIDYARGQKFVLPVKGPKTSGFGPRDLMGSTFHYGVDIGLQVGDTVYAALNGIVRVTRNDKYGYGRFVVISHKEGLETLYGHLDEILVRPGEVVKAGTPIGLGGSTGKSTGPHLHFEFRFMGQQFDPEHILSFKTKNLKNPTIHIRQEWFSHLAGFKKATYHTVQEGDTLEEIADKYDTSIQRICALNRIRGDEDLLVGIKLKVK
ncbi:MAG: M23 family metallopeptidase [Bacteroidia bacterium]|nr:M23 family metallopeptidase [Bacteroidia bacterium]MDW8158016.1 M23 family metallopeptidase [Bacteroidia bacterium]